MWPYDYFNQYSALETELEREGKKLAFVVMWFGDKTKKDVQNAVLRNIKKLLGEEDIPREIEFWTREDGKEREILRYRLLAMRSDDFPEGSILINILARIIEATFVVCDITPIGYKGKVPIFSENVMFELGLAMAWKMPEQLIILCGDKKLSLDYLPFDLKSYNVKQIDYGSNKLENELGKEYLKDRLESFKFKKDILIKNIKSNLDRFSLDFLIRQHGLMFSQIFSIDSFYHHLETTTVRHLLNIGVFRTEVFPNLDTGHYLTELGRFVLRELNIPLFPSEFCKLLHVAYWMGHNKNGEFDKKKEIFLKEFKIPWVKGEEELKKLLSEKGFPSKENNNVITAFNNYARNGKKFETTRDEIVKPWQVAISVQNTTS